MSNSLFVVREHRAWGKRDAIDGLFVPSPQQVRIYQSKAADQDVTYEGSPAPKKGLILHCIQRR